MFRRSTVIALSSLFLVTVAGCSSSSSPAGGLSDAANPGGDTRASFTCTQASSGAQSFQAGSWGNIPADLQRVPPGGTFCGFETTLGYSSALLLTSESGPQIVDFYQPMLAKLGCTTSPGLGGGTLFECSGNRSGSFHPGLTTQTLNITWNGS
jgi:hypothetical protein